MPFEQYNDLMRTCDISLSPLSNDFGIDCKSDAKFLDGSRNSLVTIASENVYANTIVNGTNGFIARNLSDWPLILDAILENHELRFRVAENAWNYVREHRLFADQIPKRRDWYKSLWERRHELTRDLMGRSAKLHQLLVP